MRPADVPSGPVVIDTDVFSYLRTRTGRHAAFAALLAGHIQAISFASYGEVLAGGYQARLGERRMGELRETLRGLLVLPYDSRVVEIWAPLHAKLKGHLHGQGTNDLWTVACAVAQDPALPVVTNNLSDFRTIAAECPRLRLVHPDL